MQGFAIPQSRPDVKIAVVDLDQVNGICHAGNGTANEATTGPLASRGRSVTRLCNRASTARQNPSDAGPQEPPQRAAQTSFQDSSKTLGKTRLKIRQTKRLLIRTFPELLLNPHTRIPQQTVARHRELAGLFADRHVFRHLIVRMGRNQQ